MKSLAKVRPLFFCACVSLALLAKAQVSTEDSKPKFEELARRVEYVRGHTLTIVRVKPSVLPSAPRPTPPPLPTADEKATNERRANKGYETIALTAHVYVGSRTVTELSWSDDAGKTYRALSNVDFRLLTSVSDIETKDTVYLWFPFVCAVEGEPPVSVAAADVEKLNPKQPDYLFLGSSHEREGAEKGLVLLDHVHAYVLLNEAKLKSEFAAREALESAAVPKTRSTPENTVIKFWLETGAKR